MGDIIPRRFVPDTGGKNDMRVEGPENEVSVQLLLGKIAKMATGANDVAQILRGEKRKDVQKKFVWEGGKKLERLDISRRWIRGIDHDSPWVRLTR